MLKKRVPCLFLGLLCLVLNVAPALAAPIVSVREGGLAIVLSEHKEGFTLALGTNSSTGIVPEIFTLESPGRLVVDVPGFQAKSSRSIPIRHGNFSSLRIGVHQGKIRAVFDLKGQVPSYILSGKSGANEFSVRFGFGAPPEEAPAYGLNTTPPGRPKSMPERVVRVPDITPEVPRAVPEPQPKVAKVPQVPNPASGPRRPLLVSAGTSTPDTPKVPVVKPDPMPDLQKVMPAEPKMPDTSINTAKTTPSVVYGEPPKPTQVEVPQQQLPVVPPQPVPSAKQPPPPDSQQLASLATAAKTAGNAVVTGLFFKTVSEGNTPALMVAGTRVKNYSLSRKKPNLFELVLENSKLVGQHLTLPQFPPDTFRGFDVVVASQQANDTVIKIYVEEGSRLSPFRAKNQLWVKLVE